MSDIDFPITHTESTEMPTSAEFYDNNNNESDFTLCSVPSPGDVTTCNCGYVDPTGGTVEVEEPTGCQTAHQHALGLLWLLLLGGAVVTRRSWN